MHSDLPTDEITKGLIDTISAACTPATTMWISATALATRLTAVLPSQRASDLDTALVIEELAKAFTTLPPTVSLAACERLMSSARFRPVPADIYEAGFAIHSELQVAKAMAENVLRDREEARAEARRQAEEAAEEKLAAEEGRETPSQKRARQAHEIRALFRSAPMAPAPSRAAYERQSFGGEAEPVNGQNEMG